MDLDKFKSVNDTKGHLEGDLVLARVGRLLEQKCRQSNVVARYGGDEFIILMPETGVEQAQILAERLRLWIAQDPMLVRAPHYRQLRSGEFPGARILHGRHCSRRRRGHVRFQAQGRRPGIHRRRIRRAAKPPRCAASMISGYIEGFLQREHTGPEHVEELISTLKKMCGEEARNDQHSARSHRDPDQRRRVARTEQRRARRDGGPVQRNHRALAGPAAGGNRRPGLCRPGA